MAQHSNVTTSQFTDAQTNANPFPLWSMIRYSFYFSSHQTNQLWSAIGKGINKKVNLSFKQRQCDVTRKFFSNFGDKKILKNFSKCSNRLFIVWMWIQIAKQDPRCGFILIWSRIKVSVDIYFDLIKILSFVFVFELLFWDK